MAVPGKINTSSSVASDEVIEVYCQPCNEEGPTLPAQGYCTDCNEHLCMTCLTVHKKHKLSKHHTLLDATSMPQVLQQPTAATNIVKPDDLTKPCDKHANEMIMFYCNDHKELLCHVCCNLGHSSTTCKVYFIPDISDDIMDSIEYQVILQAINTIDDQYQKIKEDVKKIIGKSNSTIIDALSEIKRYRQEINQTLDELERQIVDTVTARKKDNYQITKTVETKCENITKALKMSSDTIKQLNAAKQGNQLFMELKLADKTMTEADEKTSQLTSYDVKQLKFNRNEAILTKLKTIKSLGILKQETIKKEPSSESLQVTSRNVSRQGEIRVKTPKDKSRCRIKGMSLVTPNLLIIIDSNNKAVKMVEISSQSVIYRLQFKTKPFDITKVTSTELAVTLPDKQLIQFISISSNKLTKNRTIKVGGKCWGISCHHDKLVLSLWNPAELQILNMKGNVLITVQRNMFIKPRHVTTNSKSIYISNSGMKTVTRLNWKGDVIGSYDGMEKLKGTALSDDGTLFLCDRGRNVIEEISADCSTGKCVLKDLKCPYAISWCGKTKMLFHSCYSSNKTDNCIHIYKLS